MLLLTEPANIAQVRPGRCYPTRMRCSMLAAGPPAGGSIRDEFGRISFTSKTFKGPKGRRVGPFWLSVDPIVRQIRDKSYGR